MSNFPIFHGIALADNSVIENLHVERLAADPVPVNAGRIWFNTTEKCFKFSGLDAGGAVNVRTFYDAETAQAAIASLSAADSAEAAARAAADATLTSDLAAEVARASAAETALDQKIDQTKADLLGGIPPATLDTIRELAQALRDDPNIVTVLETKIGTDLAQAKAELIGTANALNDTMGELSDRLDQEIADRAAAVTAEETARIAGDSALDTRLTAVESQASGKIGNLSNLHTTDKSDLVSALNETFDALGSEVARAQSAEQALTTSLASEVSRAQAAEATLTSNLASEVTRAQAAEAQLTSDLSAEVSRATAAEGVLTTNLSAEVSRAQAAEAQLTSDLAAEVARAQAAESAEATARAAADAAETARAQAAEAAEAARAAAAEAQIRTDYNARRYTYASAAAATTHTVSHGLGSQFVDFTVMVERANGSYRNDVVSVEEVDANTLKVYLAVASNVKVSVTSMAGL